MDGKPYSCVLNHFIGSKKEGRGQGAARTSTAAGASSRLTPLWPPTAPFRGTSGYKSWHQLPRQHQHRNLPKGSPLPGTQPEEHERERLLRAGYPLRPVFINSSPSGEVAGSVLREAGIISLSHSPSLLSSDPKLSGTENKIIFQREKTHFSFACSQNLERPCYL